MEFNILAIELKKGPGGIFNEVVIVAPKATPNAGDGPLNPKPAQNFDRFAARKVNRLFARRIINEPQ